MLEGPGADPGGRIKGFQHVFHRYLDGEVASCGRDKRGVSLGFFASSLLKTSLEAMLVDVRHWSAFLYWLLATARRAREMLLRWRDLAEDDFILDQRVPVASVHRSMHLPSLQA